MIVWVLDYILRIIGVLAKYSSKGVLTPNIGIISGPINGTVSPTDERMCYVASASDVVLMSPLARNMDDMVELLCFTR